ncbi:hypothetical protein [Chenggangzhangella methanolivorans]|uniref:Uncharacterized protein n=1 Tax=Chenggangzhangella methanolivorans TaxID=1437009 RepID=A0A9E6ULV4_9HYPH|nr:hypothetical protein [Chenggangzhangella methanolivorans]QZO00977.1 hypothetical protein K6K41_05020 [Chenggangzhangella methanolivorans]
MGEWFYDLPPDERRDLTRKAIFEKRTLIERWSGASGLPEENWAPRAELAAKFLKNAKIVVDFGASAMTLERFLAPDVQYIPVDCVRLDLVIEAKAFDSPEEKAAKLAEIAPFDYSRVHVVDFNADPLPDFGADTGAALGVLEYIYDPLPLLKSMRAQLKHLVLSYNLRTGKCVLEHRERHGWVSHLTRAEIEKMIADAGFIVDAEVHLGGKSWMWSLR